MQTLDKNYISKKLAKRQGECIKCGQCCKSCKHLQNKLCTTYESRPFYCHQDFPIDELDQKAFSVKDCGYWFEK